MNFYKQRKQRNLIAIRNALYVAVRIPNKRFSFECYNGQNAYNRLIRIISCLKDRNISTECIREKRYNLSRYIITITNTGSKIFLSYRCDILKGE